MSTRPYLKSVIERKRRAAAKPLPTNYQQTMIFYKGDRRGVLAVYENAMEWEVYADPNYSQKDNYRLGDDIQSKVLAFAFGLSAEIERNLISQRTKEALARLKKEGHQVGRGQGQRNKQLNAKCVAKHKYIEGQMAKGISVSQIAKKLKIARGTLYRYLAYTGLRTPTKSRNGRWERGIY